MRKEGPDVLCHGTDLLFCIVLGAAVVYAQPLEPSLRLFSIKAVIKEVVSWLVLNSLNDLRRSFPTQLIL